MCQNQVEYKSNNNEEHHGFKYFPIKTDGCVWNLDEEHENEEDKEFWEDTSENNDTNESKNGKGKTEESVIISLLAKHFLLKGTQTVIFYIDTQE